MSIDPILTEHVSSAVTLLSGNETNRNLLDENLQRRQISQNTVSRTVIPRGNKLGQDRAEYALAIHSR